MGTRIVYQVKDTDGSVLATLYSNNAHPAQNPEAHFTRTAESSIGPSALVEQLLAARYESADGRHKAGDRMFWLVPQHEVMVGDRDAVVLAQFEPPTAGTANPANSPWRIAKRLI